MNNNDARILIVDDEFSVRDSLQKWFKIEGFKVDTASDGQSALEKLHEKPWDIVLVDIKMPNMDGLELNRHIQELEKDAIVILITAYATVDSAVQALKDGAYEYISKPIDPDNLSHIIRNALEKRQLTIENTRLRQKIDDLYTPDDIVGQSQPLKEVLQMVSAVARTDTTVMIRGASGTGKELIARAIHSNSSRRYAPIIPINCGALTDTLLESELFGHEKGAFTGADRLRPGKLEKADKGTIFFDEIGNVSQKMQMDLLRVIETKQFTRVGSDKPIRVDFRIISATNRDIEKAVADGHFREDLYFRLNVVSINIPTLTERAEDIPMLAYFFLNQYSQSMAKVVTGISSGAMKMLKMYEWPGNIRELRNVIERAVVVCEGKKITTGDLSFPFRGRTHSTIGDSLADIERAHIQLILKRTQGNVSQTAKTLDVDRTTLYNKMKKYELRRGEDI